MIRTKIFHALIAVLMLFVFSAPANAADLKFRCTDPDINGFWQGTACVVNSAVTLDSDLTIPSGVTLEITTTGSINNKATLTIDDGGSIYLRGALTNSGGTIINSGTVQNIDGIVTNHGRIFNYGTFTNFHGTIIISCDGIVYGTNIIGEYTQQGPCRSGEIPEFPAVAFPVIAVIGLMFLFQRIKSK